MATPLADLAEPGAADLVREEQLNASASDEYQALIVIVDDHGEMARARRSAEIATELLIEDGYHVDAVVTINRDENEVRQVLETAVVGGCDLVITIGGVSVTSRDIVPEVTKAAIDRELVGIVRALQASGMQAGSPEAAVSRGVVGVSGDTLIANLAQSRTAIRDGMSTLLPLARYVIDELRCVTDDDSE